VRRGRRSVLGLMPRAEEIVHAVFLPSASHVAGMFFCGSVRKQVSLDLRHRSIALRPCLPRGRPSPIWFCHRHHLDNSLPESADLGRD
jgi:hypothetical protein